MIMMYLNQTLVNFDERDHIQNQTQNLMYLIQVQMDNFQNQIQDQMQNHC
jgi:hypothetical protein